MKYILIFILLFISKPILYASEILKIELCDGDTLTGKLDMPSNGKVEQLIIYIPGTGPNTYLNHRKIGTFEFNYFDLFIYEFNKRGIAFFAYNRRGVEISDNPPYFDKVDTEKYKKYLPGIETKDIGTIINYLKADIRFKASKIVIFGASEGTMLATMVADNMSYKVDALFLMGYVNDNLSDIIKLQYSNAGANTMLVYKKYLDYLDSNKDGMITKQEYEADLEYSQDIRVKVFNNALYTELDINGDNTISSADFQIINDAHYKKLLDAIDKGNDDWIWNNYVRITSAWIKEYFELEPNKSRMLRLEMPIYIFHGDRDASVPVAGVYDIKERFAQNGKTNLTTFIFTDHDHDLNFMDWPSNGTISEGLQKIFDVSNELNAN